MILNSTILINASFTALIVILAYIDHTSYGTNKHKDFKSAILSIGILGTFFGIFWGLQEFDTKNIQESVPHLLDGLKVAFFTSIMGMSFAIVLMVLQRFSGKKSDSEQSFDFLFNQAQKLDNLEILRHLEQLNKLDTLKHLISLEHNTKEQIVRFDAILENQSRFQRELGNTISEKFDQTNHALEKAIIELARGASGELIKALEHVISDFNSQLQAQFGDNFKELNSAVDKLLSWQENYASYIEKSEKSLEHSISVIQRSGEAFEMIAARNSEVMSVYAQLKSIIEHSSAQTNLLNVQFEKFAELGDKASRSFETIDEGFLEIRDEFGKLKEEMLSNSRELKSSFSEISIQNRDMLDETRKSLTLFIHGQSELVSGALEELNSKAMLSLNALDTHNKQFTESLSERTKEVLDNILISNRAVLEELVESHNRYGEILKNSAERSSLELAKIFEETNKKLVNEMSAAINSLKEGSKEAMAQLQNAIVSSTRDTKAIMLGNFEQVRLGFDGMKNEMLKKDAAILESFQKSGSEVAKLAQSINRSFEISASSIQNLARESESAIKGGFDDMKLQVVQQHSILKEAIVQNMDAVREKIESTTNQISTILKGSISIYENELTSFRTAFFEDVKSLFESARDEMKGSANDFISHSKELAQNHILFLQELNKSSLNLPKELASSFEESFAKLNKELRAYALNTHGSIKEAKNMIEGITKELKESTEYNISQNRELNGALRESLISLDSALSHLTIQFKSDYEWFLRRIRELIGATNR